MPEVTPQMLRELSAQALTDAKTTRRIYKGQPCRPSSKERLRRAAEQLGYPPPPVAGTDEKGEQ